MKYLSLPRISGMSRRRWETRTGRGAGVAAQAVFLFCMIFLPYLWGGRQILAAGFAGIAMLLCLILWGSSTVFKGAFRPQPCRGTLVFLFFLLLGALQLSPWFSAFAMSEALSRYWELVKGTGIVHQPSILAVLPEAHREGLMMFGSAALFSFLAAQLFAVSRGRLLVLASGIAMAAALCSLTALVQHFGGHDWLFWVYKGQEQSLSGPYFNKNHFAMLQEMGLFTSLGLVLALWSAPRGSTVRALAKNYRILLMVIFAFCTVICITALLFSLSRAGILCSAAGMSGLLLYLLFFRTGRTVPLPLFLLLVSLLLVSFYGLDFVMSRLELALSGEDSSGLSRWEMWSTMLDVMALSPWWGTGIGSVRSLAPLFDLSYMPGFVTYDAHNDYLELAVAFGIPCAVLVLAFLFFFLFRYVRGLMGKSARASSLHPLAVSAMLGILVVAGHEAFDYGLKQAANLQIFVALCTLLGGLVRHIASPEGEKKRPAWQMARIFHIVPFLAAGVAFPLWGLYGNCLTAGGELARLNILMNVPEVGKAMPPETRLEAVERQGQKVLRLAPGNLAALEAVGTSHAELARLRQSSLLAEKAGQILGRSVSAQQVWRPPYRPYREQAFYALSLEERILVAEEYEKAGAYYACMAEGNPMNGLVYSAVAWCRDEASAWRGERQNALPLHEAALKLYPTHTDVLRRSIDGCWRAWQEEGSLAKRAGIAEQMIALARLFSAQKPGAMNGVYPMIWAICPEEELLIRMASATIQGQESLAEFLESKGLWESALAAWKRMEDLNSARPEEETPETLGNQGYLRRERRSRDVLERLIVRREIAVLEKLGDEDRAGALRTRQKELSYAANTPNIARADALMQRGNYVLAEEILKKMPDDERALVRYGEILLSEGRFELLSRVAAQAEARRSLMDEDSLARLSALERQMKERGLSFYEEKESRP